MFINIYNNNFMLNEFQMKITINNKLSDPWSVL